MNILVLTSVYPQYDDKDNDGVTLVVKEFVNEWEKMGHNVIVIHNSNKFPLLLNMLPDRWIKKINSKFGAVVPSKAQRKPLYSSYGNVTSVRLPMLKLLPKIGFTDRQINKQMETIINILEDKKFIPDVIVGHWEDPQIPLISKLKDKLQTKTALVFHTPVYIKRESYRKRTKKYINNIDSIGARSSSIQKEVRSLLNLNKDPFLCYSGIPDKYFNRNEFPLIEYKSKKTDTYMFAGRIIKRKNIDKTIIALSSHYKRHKFTFKIIGSGAEKDELMTLSNTLGVKQNVEFYNHKKRDEILEIMNRTEVFIMISDNETFGLVYIEALSRGCIVIASKGGGMDGIIVNNENGFLCEQGNEVELENIINNIREMSSIDKKKISTNAIKTANKFKNSNIAKEYLEKIK